MRATGAHSACSMLYCLIMADNPITPSDREELINRIEASAKAQPRPVPASWRPRRARQRRPRRVSLDEVVDILTEGSEFGGTESERAIVTLMLEAGYSPKDIAEKLSVRESAVLRLLGRSEIRAALDRGRETRREVLQSEIMDAGEIAMETLTSIMQDTASGTDARLRAAELALSHAIGKPGKGAGGAVTGVAVSVGYSAYRQRLDQVLEARVEETVVSPALAVLVTQEELD